MPSSKKQDKQDFSEKFAELESIVEYFDGDSQDIDESLKKFEQGVALSKELKEYLLTAKNRVEQVRADFDA